MRTALRIVLGALAGLVVSTMVAAADDASIPLDAITKDRGKWLVIRPPSLDGLNVQSTSLSFVFKQAGQAWSDERRAGLSLVVGDAGRIIAQVKLSPDRWSYDLDLPQIPASGRLIAALIDANGKCVTSPLADDLDLDASRIRAQLAPRGVRLDAIPTLLGASYPEDRPLTIWSPHGLSGTSRLTAALSVVEGFSLGFPGEVPTIDVKKLRAAHQRQAGILPGADLDQFKGPTDVVMGTVDDLQGWAAEATLAEITGPYVGVTSLPGTPTRWIILVSGRDRAELELAAAVFSEPSFAWPKGRAMILGKDYKPANTYALPGVVWGPDHASSSATTYPFKALGYDTANRMSDIHIPVMTLLGADDLDPDSEIVIKPNFVYAPGFRADASWQAFFDGKFMGSIVLSPEGGKTEGAEIRIPVKHLRRGANDLVLVPQIGPGTDNCFGDSLTVPATWFGDGTIEAPWIGGGRVRASLSAWAVTGHLNPASTERPVRIVIESAEDSTIAAALTIAARITKAARAPIPGLVLSESNDDAPDADLVLVGTHAWAASLLKIASADRSQYPEWMAEIIDQVNKALSQGDGRDQLMEYLATEEAAAATPAVFGWSTREGQSVVTAAFTNEALMREEAYRLVSKDSWEKLAGDYFVLGQPYREPKIMAIADPDSTATSEDPDPFARVHAWALDTARTAPVRLGIAIFVVLSGLVFALRMTVASRRVRDAERRRD